MNPVMAMALRIARGIAAEFETHERIADSAERSGAKRIAAA